jgi:IrrE N-terminal-like domain
MRGLALFCLLVLAAGRPALAEMYSKDQLDADRARIVVRITEMHRLITREEFLRPDERGLSRVPVLTPDIAPNGDPMGFLAHNGRVYLPVTGLKFVEDLTMAYAWRYRQGRSLEPFDEYLAILRWKAERDWPRGQYLDPLEAFGVPSGAWQSDSGLRELGTSLRNEAWAFLLAHELAHVLYRHPGNTTPAPVSQANERQADAFAMTIMERTDTIPLGALLYFQATAAFYMSRADLPTDAAYARWQRERATHPVNSQRLLVMARQMQLWARRHPNADRRDALFYIGDKLEQFATALDEPAMQQLIARRAVFGDPRDLRDR